MLLEEKDVSFGKCFGLCHPRVIDRPLLFSQRRQFQRYIILVRSSEAASSSGGLIISDQGPVQIIHAVSYWQLIGKKDCEDGTGVPVLITSNFTQTRCGESEISRKFQGNLIMLQELGSAELTCAAAAACLNSLSRSKQGQGTA